MLPVIFSQGGVVAINKPAGVSVEGGARHTHLPEVWQMARHWYSDGSPAHRIDKFTSGVLLLSARTEVQRYLQRQWHDITEKLYLAVIIVPMWSERTVTADVDGKWAQTQFTVLQRAGQFALVRCQLMRSGRRHQIRQHLGRLGHPIVGDKMYGGLPIQDGRPGQYLHAWRMRVRLPDEKFQPGEWTTIQAKLPEDFLKFGFNVDEIDAGATPLLITWIPPEDWQR